MSALDTAKLVDALAGAPTARLVVVFGSVARGTASASSDLDVGVSGCGYWEGLKIGAALGKAVGREAHVVDLERASDLLCFEVTREGVLVAETEPDAWMRFRAESMVRYWDLKPLIDLCARGAREHLLKVAKHG